MNTYMNRDLDPVFPTTSISIIVAKCNSKPTSTTNQYAKNASVTITCLVVYAANPHIIGIKCSYNASQISIKIVFKKFKINAHNVNLTIT